MKNARGEVKRKTRSDKRKDVKPTISVGLRDCIYRLSYITNKPVKDIAETICIKGLESRKVAEYLSDYFRRDYHFLNTIYCGVLERESLQNKYQSGKNVRITIRFTQKAYDDICLLAHALDVTPSKATAILLHASISNSNLLNAIVKRYLHDHIDQNRMRELKQVLKYINKNSPYDEEISWFSLISMIVEELKDNSNNIKDIVHSWLDRYK